MNFLRFISRVLSFPASYVHFPHCGVIADCLQIFVNEHVLAVSVWFVVLFPWSAVGHI